MTNMLINKGALVDEKGVCRNIVTIKPDEEFVPPAGMTLVDLSKYPMGVVMSPRWDAKKKCWKSALSAEELSSLEKSRFQAVKAGRVESVRSEAKTRILAVASLESQMNWYHDGRTEEPAIKAKIELIQKIRAYSNAKEAELLQLTTVEQVQAHPVDFDNFS